MLRAGYEPAAINCYQLQSSIGETGGSCDAIKPLGGQHQRRGVGGALGRGDRARQAAARAAAPARTPGVLPRYKRLPRARAQESS